VVSIFLSAFLLFLVQPLVTQFLMPRFGGSPAVWNTALVFFQMVLLLGYLYAHALARLRSRVAAVGIHALVLAVPFFFLPPAIPRLAEGGSRLDPSLWLLGVLGLMVGLPFFALSTNSSLVQHWWAGTGRPGAEDPYWLYGASNFGSLLALLAYPLLVAPLMDLGSQAWLWSVGYGVFFVVTLVPLALGAGTKAVSRAEEPGRSHDSDRARPSTARVLSWVARAALGSSLLLSVTMRITMDVGSVPLFWVLPLAVYLVTFILAFSVTDRIRRPTIEAGVVVGLFLSLGLLLFPAGLSFELIVLVGVGTLFFGGLLCHHDLARDRPEANHITLFYLWLSVGGALGGVLNSLVAPLVFDSIAEYPLTLIALALLLHAPPGTRKGLVGFRPPRLLGLTAAAALAVPLAAQLGGGFPMWGWGVTVAAVALWGLALGRYVGAVVGTGVIVAILASSLGFGTTVDEARSFFGVVRVTAEGDLFSMRHGTTVHGMQNRTPELRGTSLTYYHPTGPMGSTVERLREAGRVGVVGLGTGTLAALIDPGQEIVFHEIDPLVARMAQEHFTYLADSPGESRIVLGDGRLTLADVPDGAYDLLVLDAYSSDYVPLHLLTTEAVDLYLSKVGPDGLVLFHISNRFADLDRVVLGAAEVLDRPVRLVWHVPSAEAEAEGAVPSLVAAMANELRAFDALDPALAWAPPAESTDPVVWTDARASLLSVLR
jgi:hypothetical protein